MSSEEKILEDRIDQVDSNYEFAIKLWNIRKNPNCDLPDKYEVEKFADKLLKLFFPHFSKNQFVTTNEIESILNLLQKELCLILQPLKNNLIDTPSVIARSFFNEIPAIYDMLLLDAQAIAKNDPAATNIDEVILSYPGFLAIFTYRIAHAFYKLDIPYFPRVLTEYAHRRTGIDIHPGARIGKSFCIDHGTGIVIGQTTIIGDHVKIYQGVTLGALSVIKTQANVKRHPTIKDNVVIYSNATILGGDTTIGENSIIGGNVWLTSSIEASSIVYHKSEIKLYNPKENEIINFII